MTSVVKLSFTEPGVSFVEVVDKGGGLMGSTAEILSWQAKLYDKDASSF